MNQWVSAYIVQCMAASQASAARRYLVVCCMRAVRSSRSGRTQQRRIVPLHLRHRTPELCGRIQRRSQCIKLKQMARSLRGSIVPATEQTSVNQLSTPNEQTSVNQFSTPTEQTSISQSVVNSCKLRGCVQTISVRRRIRENQRMSKRNLCLEFLWLDHKERGWLGVDCN